MTKITLRRKSSIACNGILQYSNLSNTHIKVLSETHSKRLSFMIGLIWDKHGTKTKAEKKLNYYAIFKYNFRCLRNLLSC